MSVILTLPADDAVVETTQYARAEAGVRKLDTTFVNRARIDTKPEETLMFTVSIVSIIVTQPSMAMIHT